MPDFHLNLKPLHGRHFSTGATQDNRPKGPQNTPQHYSATLTQGDTLVVPAGTTIEGHFQAACVHVQGTVRGQITATQGVCLIDQGALVLGRVHGMQDVVIAGEVRAPRASSTAVRAQGALHLAATAQVMGIVHYTQIYTYQGSVVHGFLLPLERPHE